MLRTMRWFAVNGVFAACVWYGVREGVTGAGNLAMLYAWMGLIVSLFAQADKVIEQSAEKLAKPAVPAWLDVCVDIGAVGMFVWHGWWWTGVAYLLHTLLIGAARESAKKLLATRAQPAAA